MSRILKALGFLAAAAALLGCGKGQEPSIESATADSRPQDISKSAGYGKCPYAECATIEATGESYCRTDEGSNIAVREIVTEAQFETNSNVLITLRPGDGTNGHCSANTKLKMLEITMSIKREPGGGFDMDAGKVIGHVHLEPVTSTVGRIHWLKGTNELQLDKFDYVVYLLDEPQGAPTIVKHYRLEVFDKNCQSHLPVENVNFGLKSKFGCNTETSKRGNVVAQEATSGDGYEPKK